MLLYCYSSAPQAGSGDHSTVKFDPDQVINQLYNLMDDDKLLSDDDFFSNASSEGIASVVCTVTQFTCGVDEQEEGLPHVMQQMDKELSNTTMAESFDRLEQQQQGEGPLQQQQEGEELKPVDIDFNLVKNLLESYASQEGRAGPTSNILQSMGIRIPDR